MLMPILACIEALLLCCIALISISLIRSRAKVMKKIIRTPAEADRLHRWVEATVGGLPVLPKLPAGPSRVVTADNVHTVEHELGVVDRALHDYEKVYDCTVCQKEQRIDNWRYMAEMQRESLSAAEDAQRRKKSRDWRDRVDKAEQLDRLRASATPPPPPPPPRGVR